MPQEADPTFGIRPQALAILQLFTKWEPKFAEWDEETRSYLIHVDTYPWYAGREKGVAFTVRRNPNGQCLVIAFGELASSDQTFVDHWVLDKASMNGPRMEDRPAQAERREFESFDYYNLTLHITDVMSEFYHSQPDLGT
jgi:hypothetical protein